MKKILIILVAAAIVLALSLAFAETMTKSGELFNGITYFEPMPSCEQAAGIAAGGAAGPITDVGISNEVTHFETVRFTYGMGSCVNALAEAAPAPVMLNNGVTYFELK
jgi:hypothetical protein